MLIEVMNMEKTLGKLSGFILESHGPPMNQEDWKVGKRKRE